MRFLLDANIPFSSAELLKKFGFDVFHARNVGLQKAIDQEIIEYAFRHEAILLTKNMEFANILLHPINSHHGVIVLRLPPYFTAR